MSHPGSAVLVFLIYGLFGVLYAALDVRSERDYAVTAWTAGLIALYVAYGFVYRLPAIQDLDIFPGYFLLLPMLVFLSGELVGKLHFRFSQVWTLPLFGLGLFNAALVVPVALYGGLDSSRQRRDHFPDLRAVRVCCMPRWMSGLNASYAIIAWTAGLIALYAAYGFVYRLPGLRTWIFSRVSSCCCRCWSSCRQS